MSIFSDVHILAVNVQQQRADLQDVSHHVTQIYQELAALNAQVAALIQLVARVAEAICPLPADLKIFLEERTMSKKLTVVKMHIAGPGVRADMPPQNWSALSQSGGLALQLVDAQGNDVPALDASAVTTTGTSSDTSKVAVTATPTPLAYTLSKPAGVSGQVTIAATLNFNDGSAGPFQATLPLILDVQQASDLKLVFAPA